MGFFDWWSTKKKKKDDYSEYSAKDLVEANIEKTESTLKEYTLSRVAAPLNELKGLMGLRNLGNTCYMNSALQCLSNTPELTKYLLREDWQSQINVVNPTGSSGKLLCAYAELLRKLWCGESGSYVSPKSFKNKLGDENTQFEGYDQHDSQEFISYLIDILHEDLNQILRKPYIESEDYKPGQDIHEYAAACQENFNKRNLSYISELMYGQFKSQIECPDCSHYSITFDAFNMISIPLGHKEKMSIYVMDKCEMFSFRKISVYVSSQTTLKQLRYLLIEKEKIDKNYKFYRFGVLPERKRRKEHFEMRLFKEDHSKYQFKDLYNDEDAFSFLIDDTMPEFCSPEEESTVIALFKVPDYHKCQHLAKPVILPRRMEVKRLYELVFEMAKASDEEFHDKEFSKCFKPAEKEDEDEEEFAVYQEWPFVLTYEKKPLDEMENGETVRLEDYAFITIHIRTDSLGKTDNFGKKLAITSSDVKSTTSLSVYDCFDNFTRNETLDEDNTWYCSDCKDHKLASKEMKLSKLPKILVIHLKRFARMRHRFSKNTAVVKFPLTGLDLQDYMIKGTTSGKYNLYGVINHMGGLGGGHYIAYVKTPAYKDMWVSFDDRSVEKISSKEVVTKMAYVLFYRRVDEEDD